MRVRMHMRDCLADLDIFGSILQGEVLVRLARAADRRRRRRTDRRRTC